MPNNDNYIPFSQRNGYAEVPPQLKIGVVSDELRRLLGLAISNEIERKIQDNIFVEYRPNVGTVFKHDWYYFTKDIHVRLFKFTTENYSPLVGVINKNFINICHYDKIGSLFDLIEFFVRKSMTSKSIISQELHDDLHNAFIDAQTAYRLINGQIMAIGTEEQGEAVQNALSNTKEYGADAARSHLISSGVALRSGEWSDSIRESIHSVESVAVLLNNGANTLGEALNKIEKKGQVHPSLKKAFKMLYGYTSDQGGVRHAKVYEDTAKVDEADALFMLGACASFVSYLLARSDFSQES